jgi:hypothetical protein
MKKSPRQSALRLAALVAISTAANVGFGATSAVNKLSVDCEKGLNHFEHLPTGVNLDYLADDDRNPSLSPRRNLAEALRELGPHYLRYPGGWKSAINLWSVPPFDSSRPVLAGRIPEEWIRAGLQLSRPDGTWKIDPLDFDEFMEVCRQFGAVPGIVVPYESCYWPAMRDWRPPSRERLLKTAAAWVHYANKVKRYGVKFWEVGNESWLNNETWTNAISPSTYAADLLEFARRMKAEDPSIQIDANGNSDEWWREVLTRAVAQIDFLSVHSYPCWKWRSYEDYRTNSVDILGPIYTAKRAIENHAPKHKGRLRIAVTEFAAGTFGDWDETPADLGRALISFDLQGQLLECPDVFFSQFWTTHNIYRDLDGDVFETLHRDNSLTPIGRALWVWNRYLGHEMLATTSTEKVRCFASRSARREVTVFLLNKELVPQDVTVTLRHLPGELQQGERWSLHGNGPLDRKPIWEQSGIVGVRESELAARLEPTSVTVVRLRQESNRRKDAL